jgi:hypothetical protein
MICTYSILLLPIPQLFLFYPLFYLGRNSYSWPSFKLTIIWSGGFSVFLLNLVEEKGRHMVVRGPGCWWTGIPKPFSYLLPRILWEGEGAR